MADALKLAFKAVKRGASEYVLSAFSGGVEAAVLRLRIYKKTGALSPYPKAPFQPKEGFRGKGISHALVAYAVGFARKAGANRVVFSNFADEKTAKSLAGPGKVLKYYDFSYPDNHEWYQIVW